MVYKYPLDLTKKTVLNLPKNAEVLHVDTDPGGQLCLWANVDPLETETEEDVYVVHGTGHEVPPHQWYVGTAKDGPFMWHVFRELEL